MYVAQYTMLSAPRIDAASPVFLPVCLRMYFLPVAEDPDRPDARVADAQRFRER